MLVMHVPCMQGCTFQFNPLHAVCSHIVLLHLTKAPESSHQSATSFTCLHSLPWQGADFNSVCEMTTMFEGSIIRACRRLDELLNQLATAAHVRPLVCSP